MKYLKRIPMSLFLILAGLAPMLNFANYPLVVYTIYSYVLGISGVLAGILYLFDNQSQA